MPDGAVILGAGLAGLSAAYHYGKGCQVFEADDTPGGLIRTREDRGYRFDFTGHLLHLNDPYAKEFVHGLLQGNLRGHERRAAVYACGVYTGYPFQANTYGLPEAVARECLEGFRKAPGRAGGSGPANFQDWMLYQFGEGIAKYFMLPYNRKLWQTEPSGMDIEAMRRFVPVPSPEEVERGATAEGAKGLGYNPRFLYPAKGGIQSLADALLPFVKDLSLGQRAVELDMERKTVRFSTGYTAWYDSLLSTIPLPELIGIIKDAPGWAREAAEALEWVSVYDVDLGVRRADVTPYHWIYFPSEEFIFYRAGCLSNFSDDMAPIGCSSLYAEVSHRPGNEIHTERVKEETLSGLMRCGIIKPDDEIEVLEVRDIKYAYAVFGKRTRQAVDSLKDWLRTKGVLTAGRYGSWEYSSMEDAILEGRRAAEALKG